MPKHRYPVVFGTLMAGLGIAFYFRLNLLGDMDEKRKNLYAGEDLEARKLIESHMKH